MSEAATKTAHAETAAPVKKRGLVPLALSKAGDKVLDLLSRRPACATALVTMPGDALMLFSGVALNNWGRVTAGAAGLCANMPLIFFGDRKKPAAAEGIVQIDHQDHPLAYRLCNSWKFWRYPWEFQATLNLGQMATMTLLAGPDTASQAGQALETAAMISRDAFRPGELACGLIGTLGFFVMYIQDKSHDLTVRGMRSLKTEFNALSHFAARRCKDLVASKNPIASVRAAFNNAVTDISLAGPNTVAAKIFQVALVPYFVESLLIHDWKTAASCTVYAGANWLLSKTSKRQIAAAPRV